MTNGIIALVRRLNPIHGFLIACLFGFFIYQQIFILGAWTSVPLVDSWAVFDRFMQLKQNHMGWLTYLLNPHGAHLHSIVYFIYALDITFFSGQQFLPLLASLLATLIVDALILFAFFTVLKNKQTPPTLVILSIATALFFVNAPSGANLHIFQTVLISSRAAYATLLLGMIYAIQQKKWALHAALLALTTIAVTFHGLGALFALTVIFLHVVANCGIWRRMAAFIPLIVALALDKILLPPGAGEFSAILATLKSLTIVKLWGIFLGMSGYYASPLVNFWEARSFLPNSILLIIGAIIMFVTTAISFWTLSKIWTERRRVPQNIGTFFMALLSFLTFLSAIGAALFWAGRQEMTQDKLPLYFSTIFSARYACFASLAYAYFLFVGIAYGKERTALLARYGFATLMLLLALSFSVFMYSHQNESFDIDVSATQILADSKNVLPGIGAYTWREVEKDAYWSAELPKTVQFMFDKNLSFFHDMPHMAENMDGALKEPLFHVKLTKLPDAPPYCHMDASTQKVKQNIFHQPRILAITDSGDHVVGFSAIIPDVNDTSRLAGTVTCPSSETLPELFIVR